MPSPAGTPTLGWAGSSSERMPATLLAVKPFVLLATRDHDKAAVDEYESVRSHAGLSPHELHTAARAASALPT